MSAFLGGKQEDCSYRVDIARTWAMNRTCLLTLDTAKAYPDVTAMKVRRGGEGVSWTYEQYLTETQLIARCGHYTHFYFSLLFATDGMLKVFYSNLGSEDRIVTSPM